MFRDLGAPREPDAGPHAFRALIGDGRWWSLRELGTARSYRPGEFLLRQGERGGFVLAVTSGRVEVSAAAADGAQVLLSFRAAGDLVGEMAISSGVRSASVRAIERCTACCVPDGAFREFLLQCGAWDAFADYLASKLSETVPHQVRQAHSTPLRRLSRMLLEVLALAEHDRQDRMRIPLSQESLAGALGLARSTVAEQIAKLRRVGALAPGPRLVVADVDRLAREAGNGPGE